MVLVSFVLVVAAAVTLVVGLLQSGLGLIYVSIGCSLVAAIVLALAVWRGRPEPDVATRGPAAAAAPPPPPPPMREPEPARQPEPVGATTTAWGRPSDALPAEPPTTPAPAPPVDERDTETSAAAASLADRLRRRRESGDGDAGEPQEDDDFAPEPGVDLEDDEMAGEEPELEVVDVPDSTDEIDMSRFPIENYDRLRASEILSRLPELDPDELEMVRAYEASTTNRFTVMSRIEAELARAGADGGSWELEDSDWDSGGGAAEEPIRAPATTGRKRAGARKTAAKAAGAPAKKTTAKKTPATRSPAAKSPAAKSPAAKSPAAKKSVATRAPAKKAATKSAGAKAPGTRATASKVAGTKAPARKAPAKAVPPKATAAKKAARASEAARAAETPAAKRARAIRKTT